MVTVAGPVVAVLLAANVKVLLANDAVTPLGTPATLKVTALLKPFDGVTVIMLEPLAPCVTARLLGDAERLKSCDPVAPDEVTRLTTLPDATFAPLMGFWLMTNPAATVVLDAVVTVPGVRPALVKVVVAAA